MINVLIGVIGIIAVGIAVKLFDSEIRPYKYRKIIVNTVAISSVLSLIIGIIRCIIGR